MFKTIPFLLTLFALQTCSALESKLLVLQDDQVVLGVKAELGGRVMLFRRVDGVNVLHSNPAHWSLRDEEIPKAENAPPLTEYQGHIVWIGPASKWWKDTDGDLSPPDSTFHPDPYLLYDRCEVIEHSPTRLVLRGNTSPLNGMRMQKTFELIGNGQVRISVTVTNERTRPVTWNIWSNTRFHPEGKSGFPIPKKGKQTFTFDSWRPYNERPLPFDVQDGICSFSRPTQHELQEHEFFGKLTFFQYRPIVATYKDNLFIKEVGHDVAPGPCPEEHAPLEIYQRYSNQARGPIMELELHSPEFTLAPGESAEFSERWSLSQLSAEQATQSFEQIANQAIHRHNIKN